MVVKSISQSSIKQLGIKSVCVITLLFMGPLHTTAKGQDDKRPAQISREQAIEDVDFLVAQLKMKHPDPFRRITEEQFKLAVNKLKEELPKQVKIPEFSLSISALLALIGDDHTRHRDMSSYWEHVNRGGKLFPVKMRYKNGQMTIEAWSPQVKPGRIKVGDIVLTINGKSVESLVSKYGRYISLETDLQRHWAMEWWFDKYQVLLGDATDNYELRLRDAQGQEYVQTLKAVAPWLQQYEDSKRKGAAYRYEFYHKGQICFFHIRDFHWNTRKELEECLLSLLEEMKKNDTQYLILDLRANSGGNGGIGMNILRLVIDKPYADDLKPRKDIGWPVELAVLCDRSTYSAASWLAMIVKDCHVGVIAGEETGGRASFVGDIVEVSLPNSRLCCGIGTILCMRRTGYDDGRGVLPDLPLDTMLPDRTIVDKVYTFMKDKRERD